MKLQANNKSFAHYIDIGLKISKKEELTPEKKLFLKKTSLIDDSILIIDDIIDKSKFRNSRPCLYRRIGEEGAIIKSKLLEIESRKNLSELASSLKTKDEFKVKIIKKFDNFLKDIYLGERLGQLLAKQKKYNNTLIKNYFKMISLFTGGHVKYGVEIGQLLANRRPNYELSRIAISYGIIRQILDDFDDYFSKHHEPFGDFVSGSNRLPEILFKKFNGDKREAIELLNNSKINKFLSLVLNQRLRRELIKYCDKELKIINKSKYRKIFHVSNYKPTLTK